MQNIMFYLVVSECFVLLALLIREQIYASAYRYDFYASALHPFAGRIARAVSACIPLVFCAELAAKEPLGMLLPVFLEAVLIGLTIKETHDIVSLGYDLHVCGVVFGGDRYPLPQSLGLPLFSLEQTLGSYLRRTESCVRRDYLTAIEEK